MPLTYCAAMLPRSVRQARLGYLPLNTIIGSRTQKGHTGGMLFDAIMSQSQQFQRMRAYVSLQQLMPSPIALPEAVYTYQIQGVKQIVIGDDDRNPEATARAHFIKIFELSPTESDTYAKAVDEDLTVIEQAFKRMIRNTGKTG